MTRFGPWSTLLAVGIVFAAAVSLMLLLARENRVANRLLALLLLGFALKLMPYMLGFAGYYDAYPWLSFAPFDLGLALGPLLYLHVQRLTGPAMPAGWWRHFIPGAVQLLYLTVVFAQPQASKDAWNDTVHRDWVYPVETCAELVSFLVYLLLALRAYRAYQHWLDAHLSNREEFRIAWLRNVIVAFVIAWPLWAGYEVLSLGVGFDYFQRFPLYACFTVLVFYLGLEGWRHADIRYPQPPSSPVLQAPVLSPMEPEPPRQDWAEKGRVWMGRIEAEQWWRDPDLSLDRLAQRLGTNTAYLSRAFNDGLGMSFNDAINRLRVAEVCARLRDAGTQPVLDLAFAAGFNSKTSFNRCFRAHTGTTPTQFRAQGAVTAAAGQDRSDPGGARPKA